MDMKIGEKIKKFRKTQDVTQEKLAEYLSISYQAISKWENGTALPDITLVPSLANFFGVSTDDLFAMDEKVSDEKTKEYETEYARLNTLGDVKSIIILMRKAIELYPRNFHFMIYLAHALISYNSTSEQIKESKEGRYIEEAVRLCERILEDCTEDDIRHSAIQILCYEYPQLGKLEESKKLAYQMPTMVLCKEMLLEHILSGDEGIKKRQDNILQHIDNAASSLISLISNHQMGKDLSYKQKICFIEAANKLYETVMPDGNYLFYNCRLVWNYHRLAELWCAAGDKVKALENLEAAAKAAEVYDTLPETTQYTSIFINYCKYQRESTSKNWVGTECDLLYRRMTESVFDTIRDMPEFKKLLDKLSKHKI
ncbi:MAG: helix-turn-helix transcriptional regulator [Dehalococcoidales bacterium]|nr:helix-turn-helix transcriptional regulator [Dehalococcoidales bacterium]